MDKFVITGGKKLSGKIAASGSKNAALPIMIASILADKAIVLRRVPKLKDIDTTQRLLKKLGARIECSEHSLTVQFPKILSTEAPYDLVRTMRASVLVLGPLLARERRAKVSLPGGCAIGTRPVDIHLMGLEKMGAQFSLEEGYIVAECPQGLRGAEIHFSFPSVGATENIMMAAVLAQGKTVIYNAAREPEIIDLANFLNSMGAQVFGAGEEKIIIEGINQLSGTDYKIMLDRIEAATLLFAGPITGGDVEVLGADENSLGAVLKKMQAAGITININEQSIRASAASQFLPIQLCTEPFPGFPTDLQAQFMAFLCQVDGESRLEETIFENRFMHVPELCRMGAKIRVEGNTAIITGKRDCYFGATVMATDLRASASLVLAGLAARGITHVRRIYHLDRGYESLERKLQALGAQVLRIKE